MKSKFNPKLEKLSGSYVINNPSEFINLLKSKPGLRPSVVWKDRTILSLTKMKTYVKDYDVKVDSTTIDTSKIKFGNKGRINDAIRDYLPIPVGKNSRLIGKFNGSIPRYNGKIVHNDSRFGSFISTRPDIIKYCGIKATYPGSWQYNHENLTIMSSEPKSKFTYAELIDSVKVRGDIDLHLPKMGHFSAKNINNVRINPKAYSGIMTSKLFGRTMNKSTKFTKNIAQKVFKQCIVDKFLPDNSLWAVAGREKRIDLSTNKNTRTRLVLMCEDIVKLIGNCALQPFTNRLSRLRSGSIMIGRSMEDRKFHEFHDDIKETKEFGVIDADWSQFDNHCYKELIVTAFGLIRSCYPDGEIYDRYFLWCCCSMLYKNVVLPESKLIYKISKGIASGHPYTSVVGSIINWLLWSTAINNACPNHVTLQTKLKCMGDDTLALIPYSYCSSIEYQLNKSGMKFDSFIHRCGPMCSDDIGESKTFLKKVYDNNGLSWDFVSIIDNLLYPPKLKTIDNEIQRVRMLMYTAPSISRSTDLLTQYFYYLVELRIRDGPEKHDFVRQVIGNKLKRSWPISLRIARKWFYDIRSYDSIGIRQDDWDTRTVYSSYYNDIPTYATDYGTFTMLFNDYSDVKHI